MISFKVKRIIVRVFLVLAIAPVFFMMPIFSGQTGPTEVYAQPDPNAPPANNVVTSTSNPSDGTWSCIWNLGVCIIMYTGWAVFIKVPSTLAMLSSFITNTLFAYGFSSNTYKDAPAPAPGFINPGWVICRDIANTFFIFVLLYIAIMTILGQLSGGTKKLLMTVIVVALFMNFSMYITKFVVDAGNMVAIEFYNAFPPDVGWHVDFPGIEEHDIVKGFLYTITTPASEILDNLGVDSIVDNWPWFLFVYFIIGCLLVVFIFVMLAASFLMVGRIAVIWILMIVSPLAFFAKTTPKFEHYFGEWMNHLIKQTFFPAIFLFFIYLASSLANATINTFTATVVNPQANGVFELVITTALHSAVIAAFLIYGLKMATGMARQAGAMASKYLTMGTGAALGAGAYGLSGIASHSSAYLKDKLKREGMTEEKMKSTVFGRMGLATLNKAQNSTFDIRNTGGFQRAAGNAGLNFGRTTSLTYAQKKQVGMAEKKATFASLKTDEQKIAYLKSIFYSPNLAGSGPMHPIDFGADAREIMESIPFNERERLIASAKEGREKGFMRSLSADLGEANYSKESILAQYKALEHDPKKQASFISSLLNESIDANDNKVRARTDDEMRSVMKDLTETNRAEVETHLRTPEVKAIQEKLKDQTLSTEERAKLDKELAGTDYGAIAGYNKEVFAKLKPRQQELAKAERRNFEKEEGFRIAKKDLQEKIHAYATLNAVDQEKTRGEIAELVKKMGDNRIATLDEEDLASEHVAKHLTKTQLEKINRSNTLNLTDEHWKKIKEAIRQGDDQKAKEYLDISPGRNYGRQAVESQPIWTPDGRGVNESDLRR